MAIAVLSNSGEKKRNNKGISIIKKITNNNLLKNFPNILT
tara:strand:+ start:219 stop:338 length:120 start_codon:yes stop_codon:yes gene_type:complete